MNPRAYVLVTPARNEEATLGITAACVLAQTHLPMEWVVVSDGSTDRTDDIVRQLAAAHPFLRLLRLDAGGPHSFASVVAATEAGCRALQQRDYAYLGLLDADVRFAPDYFARLVARMEDEPALGLAGGLVVDLAPRGAPGQRQYLGDVAGAVQFFRRACFESLGGLQAIPEGGWDAITCIQARANGYLTRTFPDLVVEHLKPRNSAAGGVLRRRWQLGVRDYALGAGPVFEVGKCMLRTTESPPVVGALARLGGYAWSQLSRRPRHLPPALLERIRAEQQARMRLWTHAPGEWITSTKGKG